MNLKRHLPLRVLIVDDEPSVRQYLADEVNKVKTELNIQLLDEVSHSRDRTLYLLMKYEVDVILLDYDLPDGTGAELLEELEVWNSHIFVIFVTGHDGDQLTQDLLEMSARLRGRLRTLVKPIHGFALREALAAAVAFCESRLLPGPLNEIERRYSLESNPVAKLYLLNALIEKTLLLVLGLSLPATEEPHADMRRWAGESLFMLGPLLSISANISKLQVGSRLFPRGEYEKLRSFAEKYRRDVRNPAAHAAMLTEARAASLLQQAARLGVDALTSVLDRLRRATVFRVVQIDFDEPAKQWSHVIRREWDLRDPGNSSSPLRSSRRLKAGGIYLGLPNVGQEVFPLDVVVRYENCTTCCVATWKVLRGVSQSGAPEFRCLGDHGESVGAS